MKQILLFLFAFFYAFSATSQRVVDLGLTITSPADNSTFDVNELFNFEVSVQNFAATALQATDTVEYYLIMFGDTTFFPPDNGNHLDYTGHLLQTQESFTISRMSTFSESFAGTSVDICVFVKPKNAADPVTDADYNDNKDCISIYINPNNLGLPENEESAASLYPNPAKTHFYTTVKQPVVRDLNGAVMKADLNADGSVDCSSWANGVYLISGEGMKQPVRVNVIH